MKYIILLFIVIGIVACNKNYEKNENPFIGTWHLLKMSDGYADKGVLMYNSDGQMTAVLSKNDTMLIGYSGKYAINTKNSYITHFRDFYTLLPINNDSTSTLFVRDFTFSEDMQTLILKPRESKGIELIWRKISN